MAPTANRSSCTWRRSPTRLGSCRRVRPLSAWRPNAPKTSPQMASSMPRSAMRRSCRPPAGSRSTRSWRRSWRDFGWDRSELPLPADRSSCVSWRRPCARRIARWRSRTWPSAIATRASSASTSLAPRPAIRLDASPMSSATSSTPTFISRCTPVRATGCRPSGRRSIWVPSGLATASGLSTTSRSMVRVGRALDAWHPTSGTDGFRSSCAPPPTCTPARQLRSRNTRSTCSADCASGSRSTPTTG